MKTDRYRFASYISSRGECVKCGRRDNCCLIRTFVPFKLDVRICYNCLINYLLYLENKRIAKIESEKLEKRLIEKSREKERKENEQRKLLADGVDNVKGGKSETEKADGRGIVSDSGNNKAAKHTARRKTNIPK
jgi:hypothetical protein